MGTIRFLELRLSFCRRDTARFLSKVLEGYDWASVKGTTV